MSLTSASAMAIPQPCDTNTLVHTTCPAPKRGEHVRIAIDLDSTLINYTALCTAAALLLDIDCTPTATLDDYYLYPSIFTDKEDFLKAHNFVMAHAAYHPLMDETAPQAIRRLRTSGHQVDILTSRERTPHMESRLVAWCTHHNITVDDVVFAEDKSITDNYDIIFDDAPHHLEAIADAGHTLAVRKPWPFNAHMEHIPAAPDCATLADWIIMQQNNTSQAHDIAKQQQPRTQRSTQRSTRRGNRRRATRAAGAPRASTSV